MTYAKMNRESTRAGIQVRIYLLNHALHRLRESLKTLALRTAVSSPFTRELAPATDDTESVLSVLAEGQCAASLRVLTAGVPLIVEIQLHSLTSRTTVERSLTSKRLHEAENVP